MQRLLAEQNIPVVRVDRCVIPTQCVWRRCSGLGVQFAVDMQRGWTLGHYCDLHTPEQIVAHWTAILDQPLAPLPTPAPEQRVSTANDTLIEAFFGSLGATLVDVTPRDGDEDGEPDALPDDEDDEGEGEEDEEKDEEDEDDDEEDGEDTQPQAVAVRLPAPMPAAIMPRPLTMARAQRGG